MQPVQKFQFDSNKMSWAHDSVENGGLGIVDLWNAMGVRGEGVSILILDTGITNNTSDFTRDGISNIKDADFIKNTGLEDIVDFDGHGTNSAAIVASTGMKHVCGIAPEADIYIIRFTGNRFPKFDRLKKGIELFNSKGWSIDIISISFCFSESDEETRDLFHSLSEKHIILSALNHPDDSNDFRINNEQYPAVYKGVMPICAIKRNMKNIQSPCQFPDEKPICAFPGENILTLDEDGNPFPNANQTSIATPFGSGVFALYLSYMKKKNIPLTNENITALKKILLDTSIKVPVELFENNKEINFCRPLESLNAFNKHFKLIL